MHIFAATLALLRTFWVWDTSVMPPGFRQPEFAAHSSAVLRDGDSVTIWIENTALSARPMAHADGQVPEVGVAGGVGGDPSAPPAASRLGASADPANILLDVLAHATPADSLHPDLGALDILRRYFGAPPTPPSGDRGFHVILADIPPFKRKDGREFRFDGFFNPFDQVTDTQAQAQGQHSNEINAVYVNSSQDLDSDYLRAVVIHELMHLITHGREGAGPSLPHWMNEMLGEAAMEMSGYFTDTAHVDAYRAHTEWALAHHGYGMSYGAVALFAEYLLTHYQPEWLGRLPSAGTVAPGAPGSGELDEFQAIATVYGKPWPELYEGYLTWLFEQEKSSRFPRAAIVPRAAAESIRVAPTGVLYLAPPARGLALAGTPDTCAASRNVLRTKMLLRKAALGAGASTDQALAVWVESDPPCAPRLKQDDFEKEAFLIRLN